MVFTDWASCRSIYSSASNRIFTDSRLVWDMEKYGIITPGDNYGNNCNRKFIRYGKTNE